MNENETNGQPEQAHEQQTITEKQLQECIAQKDEWKDRCLRTAAEFENYKKRTDKEKMTWITSSQSALLLDIVAIVDDFDRAFANQNTAVEIAGFELIYKSLQKLLEKYGVQEIKEILHFDPTLHEAIMNVESSDHKTDDIVQVLQKGYLYKGQVLRPAKVSVAK